MARTSLKAASDAIKTSGPFKFETIAQTISEGRQTVDLHEVVYAIHEDGRLQKLKFDISSDSYKFQCHARVHVWDNGTNQWNFVYAIPYSRMSTPETMYAWPQTKPKTFGYFKDDRDELRRVALAVVF